MFNILCVDGGGIRGVGPAYVLTELDAALKTRWGHGVADSFHMFVGTSTGCILAAGLAATGKALVPTTPKDLYNLYYQRAAEMFTRTPWSAPSFDLLSGVYETEKKRAVLDQILGQLTMGDLARNFMGTYYSLNPKAQAVFAQGGPNYRAIADDNYKDVLVADVVNASSNAPIYFDPSRVPSTSNVASAAAVDGGVFANNPAVCAVAEAIKKWKLNTDQINIVSLGCGASNTLFPSWSHWGLMHWASPANGVPILEVILGAQSAIVEHQMESLLTEDVNYFRLQYELPAAGARIDDTSKANLDAIVTSAKKYLASPDGQKALIGAANATAAAAQANPPPNIP